MADFHDLWKTRTTVKDELLAQLEEAEAAAKAEAERIAREEHRSVKLLVISGVGTRHYYRKMGYELDGPYMSKMLIY